jgi:hypothetical protein
VSVTQVVAGKQLDRTYTFDRVRLASLLRAAHTRHRTRPR